MTDSGDPKGSSPTVSYILKVRYRSSTHDNGTLMKPVDLQPNGQKNLGVWREPTEPFCPLLLLELLAAS